MPATPEQFQLMGHRPSKLDVTLLCGAAGADPIDTTGRAALMGSYFHAMCSNDQAEMDRYANLLTKEELDDTKNWSAPLPITLDDNNLVYGNAQHELAVGLTVDGHYAASGEVLTGGTLDMAWSFGDIAYIGDIKKRTASVIEGADSLQLMAYGLAFADMVGATALRCGLWDATEAFWIWSEPIDLFWDGPAILEKIRTAALNPPTQFTTGAHCRSCYRRMRCEAHLLPVTLKGTELGALTEEGITSPEKATELALLAFTMRDISDKAIDTLKAYVLQGGEIRDGNRIYSPSERQGRESVSVKDLRAGLGQDAEQFIKKGQPYTQFDWRKG